VGNRKWRGNCYVRRIEPLLNCSLQDVPAIHETQNRIVAVAQSATYKFYIVAGTNPLGSEFRLRQSIPFERAINMLEAYINICRSPTLSIPNAYDAWPGVCVGFRDGGKDVTNPLPQIFITQEPKSC
jgi:hypothetical protein